LVTLGGRTYVRDLVSRTGVFVQERPVQEALLRHGDRVRIGEFPFEFRAVDPGQPTMAAGDSSGNHDEKVDPKQETPPLELVVEGYEAPPVPVEGPIFLIGRREGAELTLEDKRVSSAHAAIIENGGRWHLYDLNSKYGTFVNEARTRTVALSAGDLIQLGGFRLRCQAATAITDAATAPPVAAPPAKVSPPARVQPPTQAEPLRPPATAAIAKSTTPAPPRSRPGGPAPAARRRKESSPPPSLPTPARTGQEPAAIAPPAAPTDGGARVQVATEVGGIRRDTENPSDGRRTVGERDVGAFPSEQTRANGIDVAIPAELAAPAEASPAPQDVAVIEPPPPKPETAESDIPPKREPADWPAPAPAGEPLPYLGVRQCKRCGFYLKTTALFCPACGKWQRWAYVILTGGLLLVALLAVLAAVWLPRLKLTGVATI
jgi:predicted component of type VI protein secretion system